MRMEASVKTNQQRLEKLEELARETTRAQDTPDYIKKLENEIAYLKEVHRHDQLEISRLKEASVTDTLTGLCNNREVINGEIIRAIRSQVRRKIPQYFLLFIDINDFKIINDVYGHLAGDAALVYAASLFRREDFAFRFGGDEFGLIIPTRNKSQVKETIKRITKNLRDFNWQGRKIALSASIGYAEITKESSVESVLADADANMYERKKRNKT